MMRYAKLKVKDKRLVRRGDLIEIKGMIFRVRTVRQKGDVITVIRY